MNRRLRLISVIIALLALFSSGGGPWFVVQTVAWAKMWSHLSRSEPAVKAALHTFDGSHPCQLCKKIQCERKKHPPPALALQIIKFPLLMVRDMSLPRIPHEVLSRRLTVNETEVSLISFS